MALGYRLFILLYGGIALLGSLVGIYESKNHKNAYGNCHIFNLYGSFVWCDMVIFGIFWSLVSAVVLLSNDWVLFLLFVSVFWLIRSVGETFYWFNQQFSKINRNPPERFWFYKVFQNDSVWFVFQIYWQCISVVSLITSVYLFKLWLS